MDWKRRFYSTDLTRGKAYYRDGRVHDLIEADLGDRLMLLAKVQGSRLYRTQVIWFNGDIITGDCSCPVAAAGRTCKHMAAICFAKEEEERKRGSEDEERKQREQENLEAQRQSKRKQVFPFSEPPKDGKYRYFRFDRLTKDFLIYDTDLADAQPLCSEVHVDYGYDNHESQKAAPRIRAYMYSGASLTVTEDGITEVRCRNWSCKGSDTGFLDKESRRPCPHTLAMLLEAKRQALENDWGDATSYGASRILKDFSPEGLTDLTDDGEEPAEKTPMLRLLPRVSVIFGNVHLGFKIGHAKLYVVKDIDELLRAEKAETVYPIGKTDEANFANETFDAASMPLLEMMRDVQRAGRQITEQMPDKFYYRKRLSRRQ